MRRHVAIITLFALAACSSTTSQSTPTTPVPTEPACRGDALDYDVIASRCALGESDSTNITHTEDQLRIEIIPASLEVVSAEDVSFVVRFTNATDQPLPVLFEPQDFDFHPHAFEAGSDVPADETRADPPPEGSYIHQNARVLVELLPNGHLDKRLTYSAVRSEWRDAAGINYRRVQVGLLPPGTFELRVVTPVMHAPQPNSRVRRQVAASLLVR